MPIPYLLYTSLSHTHFRGSLMFLDPRGTPMSAFVPLFLKSLLVLSGSSNNQHNDTNTTLVFTARSILIYLFGTQTQQIKPF